MIWACAGGVRDSVCVVGALAAVVGEHKGGIHAGRASVGCSAQAILYGACDAVLLVLGVAYLTSA